MLKTLDLRKYKYNTYIKRDQGKIVKIQICTNTNTKLQRTCSLETVTSNEQSRKIMPAPGDGIYKGYVRSSEQKCQGRIVIEFL